MSRSRYAAAAALYAVAVAYASTIVGVAGPNFVPINPSEALSRLLSIQFVANGSDQRSDWMGNVGLLVPLGYLVAGWLSSGEPGRAGRKFGAFILCLAFIVAIKYAQLFFPPRTVTLNYVVAQSLGAMIGIFLFGAMRPVLDAARRGLEHLENLRAMLWVYTGLLIVFMLMPLDFALSADDIAAQLDKLPGTLTALNGQGRPLVVRLALTLANVIETMPIGALLTFSDRGRLHIGRSTMAAAGIGLLAMLSVYLLTVFVISGSASLPGAVFRTVGIALGAGFTHWLSRQYAGDLRDQLGEIVPWVVPCYLLTLFSVTGLLSFTWISADAAARDFYPLGLWPLFNYYIVTKPQAAKNIVAHVVMYAPIGVMVWLRLRHDGGRVTAFMIAAALSAVVEIGRFFRPGLVPDINAVPLAGIAAWMAAASMPFIWRMVSAVAVSRPILVATRPSHGGADSAVVSWRDRAAERQARPRSHGDAVGDAIGDVEHY